jgi:hypothetical protein
MSRQRTILLTFAGRRDRMQLLTRYAAAAIDAGLIDEWHVWDFTRTREDAAWLREILPVVQTTPSHTLEYFRAPQALTLDAQTLRTPMQVRAPSDVHIGLRRTSGNGPSYELVLGGWGNAISAIRTFADATPLLNVPAREAESFAVQHFRTPALLPEYGFASIDIEMGPDGLAVLVDGVVVMRDAGGARNLRPALPHRLRRQRRLAFSRYRGCASASLRLRPRASSSRDRDVLHARVPTLRRDV